MWQKSVIFALLATLSLQAYSAQGSHHVMFEKFEYTNQSMTDLGFPEDNYSPSNFYTVSIAYNQRIVVSSY